MLVSSSLERNEELDAIEMVNYAQSSDYIRT
jgi:hypothetical protein